LFAYGPADAICHPKTPSSLASFKSRLALPLWYQVVLEKRPRNGCSSSKGEGTEEREGEVVPPPPLFGGKVTPLCRTVELGTSVMTVPSGAVNVLVHDLPVGVAVIEYGLQ